MYFVIYPYKKPLQSAGVLFLMKGIFWLTPKKGKTITCRKAKFIVGAISVGWKTDFTNSPSANLFR